MTHDTTSNKKTVKSRNLLKDCYNIPTNSGCQLLHTNTLNYILDELARLEVDNWNKYQNGNEYARGKDRAYSEIGRILARVLNN